MPDYIPRSFDNLSAWLANLKSSIAADAAGLGRTAAQVSSDTALVDSLLTPVNDALQKEHDHEEARGKAQTAVAGGLPQLRELLGLYKALPGWTNGHDAGWKVVSHAKQHDMDSHHPTITAHSFPGMVVIRGTKPGFTSVNLYMRKKGAGTWTKIGTKLAHFPFQDTSAPAVPGQSEEREYQAIGVIGDAEAGQPSPIVSAVYH